MSVIRQLDSLDAGFLDTLGRLLAFESATDTRIEDAVSEILAGVKAGGDAAIIEYTRRFLISSMSPRCPSSNCLATSSRRRLRVAG